jgi:hypothetical protein
MVWIVIYHPRIRKVVFYYGLFMFARSPSPRSLWIAEAEMSVIILVLVVKMKISGTELLFIFL